MCVWGACVHVCVCVRACVRVCVRSGKDTSIMHMMLLAASVLKPFVAETNRLNVRLDNNHRRIIHENAILNNF